MNENPGLLLTVFAFLLVLGPLVFVHEMGHYLVGRWFGVKAESFSIGFGREIAGWTDKNGTRWKLGMLPLGGYVRMLDEREGEVPAAMRTEAFNNKPVGQRIAIVAAGPLANLLLCVALVWGMFVVGKPDAQADVGRAQGLAAEAGFQPGDRILLSELEHHSNIVPWQLLRSRSGVELDMLPVTTDGRIDLSALQPTVLTTDREGLAVLPANGASTQCVGAL